MTYSAVYWCRVELVIRWHCPSVRTGRRQRRGGVDWQRRIRDHGYGIFDNTRTTSCFESVRIHFTHISSRYLVNSLSRRSSSPYHSHQAAIVKQDFSTAYAYPLPLFPDISPSTRVYNLFHLFLTSAAVRGYYFITYFTRCEKMKNDHTAPVPVCETVDSIRRASSLR